MRVSELVTVEEINTWRKGDIITIEAGTGVGKSYFIKNNLYAIAKRDKKRILMLLHRVNCVYQFQHEIEMDKKTDIIDIETYQSIEAKYKKNETFDFEQYDYIICDEWHYFMGDASFNKYTDLSLNRILNTNSIRIFMSATGSYMSHYINEYNGLSTIDYKLPIDFSFIERLEFFYKDSTMERYIIEAIQHNKKAIFFVQSAKKAYELHQKFKDHTLFNCSKNNKKYYQFVDTKKIDDMLINERFEELILITTTVMDAGVNIIDSDLKHIVCDVSDTGTLIQCIGRKRLQNEQDSIILHVKAISPQRLGGMETQATKKVRMARYFSEHGEREFVKKYYREVDNSHIVYDDVEGNGITKKRNDLMYFKTEIDLVEIETIKEYEKQGYCKYIAYKFGFHDGKGNYRYTILETEEKGEDLKSYLDSIVGLKLHKAEQEKLKGEFQKNGLSARTLGINTLNGNLKDRKMNYLILSKRTSEWINGKPKTIRYWEVVNNIEV